MILKDFLFALRLIQNRLGFYGFVILTLAIAIGASTALFSLLFGVVLAPLDYSEAENLVRIWQTTPDWVTSKSDRVPVSYPNLQAQAQFVSSALAQTEALLGTSTIGVAGAASFANWSTSTIVPETHAGPEENLASARVNTVSFGYFQALGIQLSAGRDFANQDDFASDPVSIINQRVAELDFHGLEPLGRKLKVFSRWTRIVGVVRDARQASLTDGIPREVFLPVSQRGLLQMTLIARLTPDPSAPAQLIQTLRAIEPEAVLETPLRFRDLLSDLLQSPRVRSTVFSLLAAMAAMVSFVGVFGVVSNAVNGRSQEFGIRLALGATGGDLKREILLGNLRTIGLGIVLGLVLFAFLSQLLSSQLFGLTASNPVILALAIVVVTAIAALAAYLPSLGVSKIDPVAVLRRE